MVRKYFRGISLKNEQNLINNWVCEKERKMTVFHVDTSVDFIISNLGCSRNIGIKLSSYE